MDESIMGEDVFAQRAGEPATKAEERQPFSQDLLKEFRARQDNFIALAEDFYQLWRALPDLNVRQVDARLVPMYERLLALAPSIGVSRNGLQQLRECCGKKRAWPIGLLQDPSETLDHVVVPLGTFEELGWWPGDIIRRITRFFGAAYCEKCDRRRRAINRFFGKRD